MKLNKKKRTVNRISDQELKMLEECQSAADWGKACDTIKDARGGVVYPSDWWDKVKLSGMMDRIMSRWGADSNLTTTSFSDKKSMMEFLKNNK